MKQIYFYPLGPKTRDCQKPVNRAAKRYASAAASSSTGHIDGAATERMLLNLHQWRLRCRFGHFRGHADQWVRLSARGFLLVFYSKHSSKINQHETDGKWTDGLIKALLNALAMASRYINALVPVTCVCVSKPKLCIKEKWEKEKR